MFRWLTRNDGKRVERAKRRLGSPRASVFSEFALIAPILVLVCSALVEIVGFWDAQVMANHAAWTVGRIVMVRGSDGLEYSSGISKKSKTGIAGSSLPAPLKAALSGLDTAIQGANKFNNRGNIATLFLMSTCGIGYYGSSPGKALADGFDALINAVVKGMTDGIAETIKNAVADIKIPFSSGGTGIEKFVSELVKYLVDKVVEVALKPIAEAIKSALQSAFDNVFGKGGIKVDEIFSGKSGGARMARQIYGAAVRIARAKSTIGKEVVTVTDMDDLNGPFMFAKLAALGRLIYPQVVDKEAKSDGFFVTGAHGWPANYGGLAMAHVEVNWPYESGWLFPVVSGRGVASSKRPVATGHSMVFPQPDIQNEHLYSAGAKAFDPGSYTNKTSIPALDQLAKEMKEYLKFVKFGMQFRICIETLSFHEGNWSWGTATRYKYCSPLHTLFGIDTDNLPAGGEYGYCWNGLTDGTDGNQNETWNTFNKRGYSLPYGYHNRDYYYWDGSYHKSYHQSICSTSGNAGLAAWYDGWQGKVLAYKDSSINGYSNKYLANQAVFNSCVAEFVADPSVPSDQRVFVMQANRSTLYAKVCAFADRNKVNVYNLVKWQEGHDLEAWKEQDAEIQDKAKKAEGSFAVITKLVRDEIADIENMEHGTSSWTGDDNDPVFDPADEEVMKDPDAAAKRAREKWAILKSKLKSKLKEIDAAAEALRNEWTTYQNAAKGFMDARARCVQSHFPRACLRMVGAAKSLRVLDPERDSGFKIPAGYMPYDIGRGTRDMLARLNAYQRKLNDAYQREVEYGSMLGLSSAGRAKRDGKTPDQVVDEADGVPEDSPGSLAPGSDSGQIIDKDRQTYSGGKWIWN